MHHIDEEVSYDSHISLSVFDGGRTDGFRACDGASRNGACRLSSSVVINRNVMIVSILAVIISFVVVIIQT